MTPIKERIELSRHTADSAQRDQVEAAARRLNELGYGDVFACDGSFSEWKHENAPIYTAPPTIRLNFLT